MADAKETQVPTKPTPASLNERFLSENRKTRDFQDVLRCAQALYQRIPQHASKPTFEHTKTYLRRLERLHQSCSGLLMYIHYPPVAEQKPTNVVQNVVYSELDHAFGTVGPDQKITPIAAKDLGPNKVAVVLQQRCDAIIIASSESCRATKSIENPHFEILFVLAIDSVVAQRLVNDMIFGFADELPVFLEVPASWSGFLTDGGFEERRPEEFGTTIPPQSFLKTWKIDKGANFKPLQNLYLATPGTDTTYPADSDLKMPAIPPVQNAFFANTNPYPKKPQEAQKEFLRDKDGLVAFASNAKGVIDMSDEAQVRVILARMFNFAQTTNTQATWNNMIEVERIFSEFGIMTQPSTQTWFTDIIGSKDVSKIKSNLQMLRNFVSHFPEYAPQQIAAESQIRNSLSSEQKQQSLTFIRKNITQASDFAYVTANTIDALHDVHSRLETLRVEWRERYNALKASVKALEETASATSAPAAQKDAPLIALQQKMAEIAKTATDVEAQFRAFLENRAQSSSAAENKRRIADWISESHLNEVAFRAFAAGSLPVTQESSKVADEFAQNLLASSKDTNIAGAQTTTTTEEGMTELKKPEVKDGEFQTLLESFNKNMATLNAAESKRKDDVRNSIATVGAECLAASQSIKTILEQNTSIPDSDRSKNWEELTLHAKGCDINFRAAVGNPKAQKNGNPSEEAQVSESDLINIHNILVNNKLCLERYYTSMQLLAADWKQENEAKNASANQKAAQDIANHVRLGSTAIVEAKTLFQTTISDVYVKDTEGMKEHIRDMEKKQNELQTIHRTFDAKDATEKIRKDTLKRSEETLAAIVRIGLNMRNKFVEQTDQVKLLHAMQNSSQNVEHAKIQAQKSAELAKQHLDALRVKELAHVKLLHRDAVLKSDKRNVTVSFDSLDQRKKERIEKLQIQMMSLMRELENNLSTKTEPITLYHSVLDLDQFVRTNHEFLQFPQFKAEKDRMRSLVMKAQKQLKAVSEFQQVATLLEMLDNAVDEEDVNQAAKILNKLDQHKTDYFQPQDAEIVEAARALVNYSDSEDD